MKIGITKAEFIKSLEGTLKLTREGIHSLDLFDEDTVIVYFEDGNSQRVNIAYDSAMAIIRDVAKNIG